MNIARSITSTALTLAIGIGAGAAITTAGAADANGASIPASFTDVTLANARWAHGRPVDQLGSCHGDRVRTDCVAWHPPHRPCPSDDGGEVNSWCVWDAQHMGNGIGDSYWLGHRGRWHRVTHHRAHRIENWRRFHNVDGHRHCHIARGETSFVYCADGFMTSS